MENINTLISVFENEREYCFQEEIGENGTKHLQGYTIFNNPRVLAGLKKIDKRIHWEIAENIHACREYCRKEKTRNGKRWSSKEEIIDEWEDDKVRPWQQEILKIIEGQADKRKIYWYWDKKGNCGKTTLAKHIILNNKRAIYVNGSTNDIKCAISSMEKMPKIVIWDLPRTNEGKISYSGIEQIKNGIFFSTKYESRMVVYNIPHVIVLANFEPEEGMLSKDRLIVQEIG
jgi:hypothetical protein